MSPTPVTSPNTATTCSNHRTQRIPGISLLTTIKRRRLMVGVVGKGRPVIGPRITIRFDAETRRQLDEIAADRNQKIAEVIRDLVKQALKGQP
jgi:hypothetical protein